VGDRNLLEVNKKNEVICDTFQMLWEEGGGNRQTINNFNNEENKYKSESKDGSPSWSNAATHNKTKH